MTPQQSTDEQARWMRVKEAFSKASEADPREMNNVVDAACGADSQMADEVHSLLRLHQEDALSLDRATPSEPTLLDFEAPPRHNPGELLAGRYQIARFLCAGGMGAVYAALDLETEEKVALKFMHAFPMQTSQALTRFRREVELARSILHPNVCRTFGLVVSGDEPFCVMQLLEGETLAQTLARRGPMTPTEALPLVLQICDGLTAAHAAGVLHRDLKPGNIFLVDGKAVLIDFGLAVLMNHQASLTSPEAVVGTLAYLAPEQLNGASASAATDIYSLGVILYEMLTGTKPFAAKSPLHLAAQKARQSGEALRLKGVPALWQDVIGRCMHAKAANRFRSPAELRRALERGKPGLRFVLSQPKLRWPLIAAAILGVAWLGWSWSRQEYRPSVEAAGLYAQAKQSIAHSKTWRAVQLLEQAAAADPRFLKAQSSLAVAYSDSDQLDKARDRLIEASAAADRRIFLGPGERLSLAAARGIVMRNSSDAANAYRGLARISQGLDHSAALLSLARIEAQRGNQDEAIRTTRAVLAEDPGFMAGHVFLGALLSRKREYRQASEEFTTAQLAFEKVANWEGLSDLLLVRAETLRTQSPAITRQEAQRVLEFSGQTGNRHHFLRAKFQFATLAQSEGDFEQAMALARDAANQAEREGMLALAARGWGDFGYGFYFLRRYEPAGQALQEAVNLAERAKTYNTLAINRLRLGEVLTSLQQHEEARSVMKLAVDWFRQNKEENLLPLILIKWGTASRTHDLAEAETSFLEALAVAERIGDEMSQSMALQRLGNLFGDRDLKKADEYHDRARPLLRKVRNTGVFFQASRVSAMLGEFQKAEGWIVEGEAQIADYPNNLTRVFTSEAAHLSRSDLLFYRGQCSAALQERAHVVRNKDNLGTQGLVFQLKLRRIQVCVSPGEVPQHLAWALQQFRADPPLSEVETLYLNLGIGEFALRSGKWKIAKKHAEEGLAGSRKLGLRTSEIENLLVLRAAEMRLGHSEQGVAFTKQLGLVASQLGIGEPPAFRGRADLQLLWNLAGSN